MRRGKALHKALTWQRDAAAAANVKLTGERLPSGLPFTWQGRVSRGGAWALGGAWVLRMDDIPGSLQGETWVWTRGAVTAERFYLLLADTRKVRYSQAAAKHVNINVCFGCFEGMQFMFFHRGWGINAPSAIQTVGTALNCLLVIQRYWLGRAKMGKQIPSSYIRAREMDWKLIIYRVVINPEWFASSRLADGGFMAAAWGCVEGRKVLPKWWITSMILSERVALSRAKASLGHTRSPNVAPTCARAATTTSWPACFIFECV